METQHSKLRNQQTTVFLYMHKQLQINCSASLN